MPAIDDLFSQVSGQKAPAPQPAQTTTPAGPDYSKQAGDLVSELGSGRATTPDETHGLLYKISNNLLNYSPDATKTGNGTLDKIGDVANDVNPLGVGPVQGVAKGALSTAAGFGSIFNKLTGSNQPFSQENLKDLLESHGVGQGVGKMAEQIAEIASGEGAAKDVAAKVLSNPRVAGTIAQIVNGALTGAVQSGGNPLAAAGSAAVAGLTSPLVKLGGTLLSKYSGMRSGGAEAAIERALTNPDSSGLAKVMRKEWDINDVMDNVQKDVTGFRDDAAKSYSSALSAIKSSSIPNWDTKAANAVSNTKATLAKELQNFGAKLSPDGTWNFKQVGGVDKEKLQDLVDLVNDWDKGAKIPASKVLGSNGQPMTSATRATDKDALTAGGLDSLKKQVGEYVGEGGSLGALADRVYGRLKNNLETIIPKYGDMTKDYAEAQEFLRNFKSEMSVNAAGTINPGTATRKVQNLFKQATTYKEDLMNRLPHGQDLLDQIAGLHLSEWTPKGIMKPLSAALISSEGFGHAAVLSNPYTAGIAVADQLASSPRIAGEVARAVGKGKNSPLVNWGAQVARKASQAGINNAGQQ